MVANAAMAESTKDAQPTIAEQKTTLRTWFARYFDDVITAEEAENWFDSLGACTGKDEISNNKEKLTAYLMKTKGFNTGEDFVLSTEKDMEEADANMKCELSEAALRTIHRYMTSREEATHTSVAEKTTVQDSDGRSHNSGNNSGGVSGTNTMLGDDAAKAFLKIAGAVNTKVPEMKEKYITVKLVRQHVKAYIRAKQNEWGDNGLYEAIAAIRNSMDR